MAEMDIGWQLKMDTKELYNGSENMAASGHYVVDWTEVLCDESKQMADIRI